MMLKKTKIVASISDLRCEVDFIRSLFEAGMNVVRMNTAHGTREGMDKLINNVREVSNRIAILIDTKGPEVRTTKIQDADQIEYHIGDKVRIVGNPDILTTREQIAVSYPKFVTDLNNGDDILIDDGEMELKVIEKTNDYLLCEVQNESTLGSRKSVNVPGVRINLPSLTERDKENIKYAIERDIDFIAHSFVRTKQDVLDIREILDEYGSDIQIIAKIENQEGVDNIDEIIEASYGIMIARGDLGIEVPLERIPGIQRDIINKCIRAKKPVIVATQMLHTMINNPRPTRAEVTDIANAIYMRTDALMLSGETASGKYPVEAVKTMSQIAEQAEQDVHREGHFAHPLFEGIEQREYLAKCAIEATEYLGVKGIITDSKTGQTARHLSAFRGPTPILAICLMDKTQRWLNLSYGVIPILQKRQVTADYQFCASVRMLRQKGYVGLDDKIAYLSGTFDGKGNTTFLEINKVCDIFDDKYKFHVSEK